MMLARFIVVFVGLLGAIWPETGAMVNSSNSFDVVVVGGGPAGSTASYLLAKRGLQVVLLDKSSFPRAKLCGGSITQKTVLLLQRLFSETPESLLTRNILNHRSHHYQLWFRDRLVADESIDVPMHFADRAVYDKYFLDEAREAGASIREGVVVTSCDPVEGVVSTSSGEIFRGKFIIAADGVNSAVRKFVLPPRYKSAWNSGLATALEVVVDRTQPMQIFDRPMIFLGFVNHGYAWVFPHKDKVVVGLGGLNRCNRGLFLRRFRSFTASLGVAAISSAKVAGYPMPYGNFLTTPSSGRALLIGDAAGFADSLFGEGIFYAHKSAEVAVQAVLSAVDSGRDLNGAYHMLLRQSILPQLEHKERRSRQFFTLFNVLGRHIFLFLTPRMKRRVINRVHGEFEALQ